MFTFNFLNRSDYDTILRPHSHPNTQDIEQITFYLFISFGSSLLQLEESSVFNGTNLLANEILNEIG